MPLALPASAPPGANEKIVPARSRLAVASASRIGRAHVVCDNMCVSILGGTQPDKVRGYLYQARQENDGLLQRFQLLVYSDTVPYAGMVDEYPDAAARDAVFGIFDTLARADFAALAETDSYGKIPHLRFADDAQTLFAGWYDHLQGQKVEAPDEAPLMVEYARYRVNPKARGTQ